MIRDDGTAEFSGAVNLHGAYEGAIFLGDARPHRFEGVEPETGEAIAMEFVFDAEADTLTLASPEGGSHVHYRK